MRLLHHKTSPHRQADKDKFVQNQQSSPSRRLCTRSQVLWVFRHFKVMTPRHLMRSGCKPLRRWACSPLGSDREAGGGNSHKSRQTLWRNRIWCIAGKLRLIMCSSYKGQPLGCRAVPHVPRSPCPQAPFHSRKRCTSRTGAFVSRSWSSGTRCSSLGSSPRQVPARPPEAEFALSERSLWGSLLMCGFVTFCRKTLPPQFESDHSAYNLPPMI